MSSKTFENSFLPSIHQYVFDYAQNIIKQYIGSNNEVDSRLVNLYQIHNRNQISFNRFKLEFYEPCRLRIAFNKILQASKNKSDLPSVDSHLNCWIYKNKIYVMYSDVREKLQWTLDRIDNKQGHNSDNVLIACLACNLKRKNCNKDSFLFTKQLTIVKRE